MGLSASTYNYYESSRVPPADVIVRIADLGGVDVRWLITGQVVPGPSVPASHPAVRRAAEMLADYPDAAGPLAAFLDILAETFKFPAKPAAGSAHPSVAAPKLAAARPGASTHPAPVPATRDMPATSTKPPKPGRPEALIPVLGRSAAGIPCYWTDPAEARRVTQLADLVSRRAEEIHPSVRPAVAEAPGGPGPQPVSLVTCVRPDSGEPAEFLGAEAIRSRYSDAFALRIDGQSMAPDICHGDLVVLSPSQPARDGRPAVVQLRNQIGVTCKLYRRTARTVHLIPVNEQFPPTTTPVGDVVWALRVLARVRPG